MFQYVCMHKRFVREYACVCARMCVCNEVYCLYVYNENISHSDILDMKKMIFMTLHFWVEFSKCQQEIVAQKETGSLKLGHALIIPTGPKCNNKYGSLLDSYPPLNRDALRLISSTTLPNAHRNATRLFWKGRQSLDQTLSKMWPSMVVRLSSSIQFYIRILNSHNERFSQHQSVSKSKICLFVFAGIL